MDTLLKQHFWAINLLALTLLAWLVAASVNDYLAAKLFAIPSVQADLKKTGTGPETAASEVNGPALGEDLRSWVMFNTNKPEEKTPDNSDDGPDASTNDDTEKPDGELDESELPIDLMGTIVADQDALSMATLRIEGENKLAWVGSEFMEGKAKIVEINPRHIVVKEAESHRVIKLWTVKAAQAIGRPNRGTGRNASSRGTSSASRRNSPTKTGTTSRLKAKKKTGRFKGVKKTGAYSYDIERPELNKYLDNLGGLGSQARVIPNHVGGRTQGYKLVGVRPNSLFRTIGIRSGDVIMSVNGQPIDSAAKALGLFDKLKSEAQVGVTIERRGQQKDLSYSIQ
jgi:type II secretion system protein C